MSFTVQTLPFAPDGDEPELVLRIIDGLPPGQLRLPSKGEVVIGRSNEADLTLEHPSVSRRHARLTLGPNPTLQDLGSANGTRLRDQRLEGTSPIPLHHNDVIELGAVLVVFQSQQRVRSHWHPLTREELRERVRKEIEICTRTSARFALLRLTLPTAQRELVFEELRNRLRVSDAVGAFDEDHLDVLLSDSGAPRAHELLRRLAERTHERQDAVEGAAVEFPSDARSAEELFDSLVQRTERSLRLRDEKIVVESPEMERIHHLLRRIAPSALNVVLHGETGVGKEVLVQRLHTLSPRANAPLMELNCAAIPEALVESELFGHERGAFTGAANRKLGLLESADGGTVFLDEVAEMPLNVQAKLLRTIETKTVHPVGANEARSIDVRFVCATHRDLDHEVAEGRFREDLYFRLNGITVDIPPLRERVDEIIPFARYFLNRAAAADQRIPPSISADAQRLLLDYAWPGNVRELKNYIERAYVLCAGDRIEPSDLPESRMRRTREKPTVPEIPAAPRPTGPPSGVDLRSDVEKLERQRILDALDTHAGNQTAAAQALGMPRSSFLRRLERYGIRRPRKR